MLTAATWRIDPLHLLTRRELAAVLADLEQKAPRSESVRLNRVVVRLACCCGLRVSEIAGLRLADVQLEVARPHLRIRAETAKGAAPGACRFGGIAARSRTSLPGRRNGSRSGARPDDFFVASARCGSGRPLSRHTLRKRFRTACKVLGLERLKQSDNSSWPTYVREPQPGRWPNPGRSSRRGRAFERPDHERLPACCGG